MSRDGSGAYSLPGADLTNGSLADADEVMAKLNDIATALTGSLAKDGQTTPTANLPMGGFGHTGVAVAASRTMYARASQIADGALTYGGVAGGTADALTIAPSPAITAYVIGQRFQYKSGASANTTAVTLNVNSVGSGAVTWPDGTALVAGDHPANALVEIAVVTTAPTFHLLTQTRGPGALGAIGGTGATFTSTDASAAAGPSVTLDRNSASPAASDVLGEVLFKGRDNGAGTDTYGRVYSVITDPVAASEDGELRFDTPVAGTLANRLRLGAGLYTPSATGGDKGVDTVNAVALYEGGVRAGLPLLATLTGGGTAYNFTATNTTLYAGYFCLFSKVFPATDGATLQWEVSIDAGSNYITTGTYYNSRIVGGGTTAVNSAGSLTGSTVSMAVTMSNANAAHGFSGDATVTDGGAAANATEIVAKGRYGLQTTGEAISVANASGSNTTASQVNAFRFRMSSGNITSGTIRIYGIPK